MNRAEKQELLKELGEMYSRNQFVFLISMKAVTASTALAFRREIRQNDAIAIVAKNTLNKIASKKVGLEMLSQYFTTQMLTVFTNNPVEVAKILGKYETGGLTIVAGSDKQTMFMNEDVKKLATLASLPVLRGMLLSTILGVHRKTVRVLSESAASLTRLIATKL
jgi:large subunit ribosomal protein L10